MRILCTGASGMLGQELLPRLLAQGHHIWALSRKPRRSDIPNLNWVRGNVTEEHFGRATLDTEFDAVIHMAALTSLRERNKNDLFVSNYLGTQNVVNFCLARSISKLFYVSTLYVCGSFSGTFREEDLNVGQRFKNRYEESKFYAETFVHNHPTIRVTVLRPGILVGRYSDGHAAMFEGFYRPIRALVIAHDFAERKLHLPRREVLFEEKLHLPIFKLPLRLYGDPDSTLALTPVDWAAEQIAGVVTNEPTQSTYNIVPGKLPALSMILEAVCEVLAIQGYHVGPGPTRNPLDMFYNRLIRDFRPYLQDQPVFETSVGHTCPPVDREYVKKIVAYWRVHDISISLKEGRDAARN